MVTIAEDLGTAREVVSRHLKHLESVGLVRLRRSTVEVCDYHGNVAGCAPKRFGGSSTRSRGIFSYNLMK